MRLSVAALASRAKYQESKHRRGTGGKFADKPGAAPPTRPAAGKRSGVALTDEIRVEAPSNPKRPGTASHERFARYRTGMTVQEYLDAHPGGDRRSALADLAWDMKKGYVSFHPPGTHGTASKTVERDLSHIQDLTRKDDIPELGTPERELHDSLLRSAALFANEAPKSGSLARTNHDAMRAAGLGIKVDFRAQYIGNELRSFTVQGPFGVIKRTLDRDTGVVEHALFSVQDDYRGGAAKTFLSETVDVYAKAGYKTIKVHANIDVGGYAWLRYGFKPDENSTRLLSSSVSAALTSPGVIASLGGAGEDVYDHVKSLYRAQDLAGLAAVRTLVPRPMDGKMLPFGQAAFLGTNWYGTLDLKDERAMRTFRAYSGSKK